MIMDKQIIRITLGLALFGAALSSSRIQAQSLFTYSGGNGSPLDVTLNSDIQFTVTANVTAQYGIGFAITDAYSSPQTSTVGSPDEVMFTVTSGLTLSDSMGAIPSYSMITVGVPVLGAPSSGYNTASLNDETFTLFFETYPNSASLPVGDVITLSPGTGVSMNYASIAPTCAPDDTIVVHDGEANLLDSISTEPVPEPTTLALAGLGGLGLLLIRRRK
jgi:hypothetical protein